jgi:hypothetical protein
MDIYRRRGLDRMARSATGAAGNLAGPLLIVDVDKLAPSRDLCSFPKGGPSDQGLESMYPK